MFQNHAVRPSPQPGLISVVIPAYNSEKYLASTLDSVLAQDSAEHEILLVDDGSTDSTAEIARSYGGVRYLNQANQGAATARNTGVMHARGEFIAFLDADDLWLPHKSGVQLAYLRARPGIACVVANQRNCLMEGVPRPDWISDAMLDGRFLYSLGTVIARRWAFEKIGGFDPCYRNGDDLDWFVRLMDYQAPIGWMKEETVMLRRVHLDNISYKQDQSVRDHLRILKASIDRRHKGITKPVPAVWPQPCQAS